MILCACPNQGGGRTLCVAKYFVVSDGGCGGEKGS